MNATNYSIETANDKTQKVTFSDGYTAVIIPTMNEKYAVCVSCQLGCPVGCKFCYTGKMGFKRNLTQEEIVNQIETTRNIIGKAPTTVVFMGMGEPLLNLKSVLDAAEDIHKKFNVSYQHITISTSCLSTLSKLLDIPFNVALSIHSPFDDIRKKIMPPTIGIREILAFADEYCRKHPRKELMIEYALMKGVNDREEDLAALQKLPWPKAALFNFIQFNDIDAGDGTVYRRSEHERLLMFKQGMIDAGFKSFVRLSPGNDIKAACGMLDQPNIMSSIKE